MTVFAHIENDGPSQRIRRCEIGEPAAAHAAQTVTRRHHKISIAVFANRKDLVTRQSILCRIGLKPAVREETQAAAVEPHPYPALAVLIHRSRLVTRQPFASRINRKHVIAKTAQPAVHPHPQIAFAILKYGADPVAIVTAIDGRSDKPAVFQPAESAVGSDPEITVAVFPKRADESVGKPVPVIEFPNLSGWRKQ